MSWKMVGNPKVRKLTKGLATEFAEMLAAPHDRPLNSTRCAVLKHAFDTDNFRTCEWATAYCEQTKQTYRVNGKHSSTVLSTMSGIFPKDLSVIVEEYHCDTMEDVAALYATFDLRSSARSTGDINQIYAAACPELEGVSSKIINLTIGAVSYHKWEDEYTSYPVNDRARLIIDNVPFCLWLVEILAGHGGCLAIKHLHRMSVAAAMYKTWLKAKGPSTEFWTLVRDETGPRPDCPDRKLAKLLVTTRLRSKQGVAAGYKPLGTREMYVKCLHGWNAWRSGESTNLNYYSKSDTPAAK